MTDGPGPVVAGQPGALGDDAAESPLLAAEVLRDDRGDDAERRGDLERGEEVGQRIGHADLRGALAEPPAAYVRISSRWTGCTCSSPFDVDTKTGNSTTTATTACFAVGSTCPNHLKNTGARATIGVAARAAASGVRAVASGRNLVHSNAITTAMTTPATRPVTAT